MRLINNSYFFPTGLFFIGFWLFLFTANLAESRAQSLDWLREDLTIQEKSSTTGGPQASARESGVTVYMSRKAFRRTSSDGADSILRFDDRKIVTIDNTKKTYTETTFDDLQKKLDESLKSMDKEGGENSKQAMEAMKKMFGGMTDSVKVTKQGSAEKIAGYATEKYLMEMGMFKVEMWCAPELKMPAAYYDSIKARMPKNSMFDMSKLYDELKKIDGYPVKQARAMNMMGATVNTITEVTSVQKGSLPDSTFAVPAGFKQEAGKF